MAGLLKLPAHHTTAMLALGLMAIIAVMVLPTPPLLLDIGLTISFALAILVLTITVFIERPLDFSSFPTILLASLMLRLALNVASTRLIIGEGHTGPDAAGHVIQGFSMFVMGGNIVLGLVVFCVILIVNFIVITKGAGRMAEVGARFALDGMPGRQLAIDSDVAAGAISHAEAKERRRIEQEETTFFGSLDGASKFVKGDAIAGLLITLLNIVVGISIGIGVHGLSVGEAVETYSILTVGDGLVSQIPAVVISVAAALLLSKGGAAGAADKVVFAQLGAYPAALATVGAVLALFSFVPGLPFIPFFAGAAASLGAAWLTHDSRKKSKIAAAAAPPQSRIDKPIGDLIDVDEIHVEFAPDLVPLALDAVSGLESRIVKMRNHVASEFGFIIPPVRLTDNPDLASGEYVIRMQGVESARDRLRPDRSLIIIDDAAPPPLPGEDVAEPVYGAPARWIPKSAREDATALGLCVIEPGEVLATHLLETIKASFGRLLSRRSLRAILDEYTRTSNAERSAANRRIIDEFIPEKAPIDLVQAVFRNLLEEQVPVRNIPLILESIAEARSMGHPDLVAEHVRQRLGRQITAGLRDETGALPLIQLAPHWEQLFSEHEVVRDGRAEVALPPEDFNKLAKSVSDQIKAAAAKNIFPAVVAFAARRRFVRSVLHAKGIRNPVVSYEEIDPQMRPRLVGVA
jgi:flagellar biosynthesis protein FlhA